MLRSGLIGSDKRQIDLGLHRMRKLDLGFLCGFFQALQGHLIFRKVDALILFELFDDPFDQALVNVVAAQMRVAVRGLYFDHAFANFQD